MTWYFNRFGISSGVKDFVVSALKTGGVAILAYVALKLNNLHVPAGGQYVEVYTAVVVLGRALISGLSTWLTTSGPDTSTVPVVAQQLSEVI